MKTSDAKIVLGRFDGFSQFGQPETVFFQRTSRVKYQRPNFVASDSLPMEVVTSCRDSEHLARVCWALIRALRDDLARCIRAWRYAGKHIPQPPPYSSSVSIPKGGPQ